MMLQRESDIMYYMYVCMYVYNFIIRDDHTHDMYTRTHYKTLHTPSDFNVESFVVLVINCEKTFLSKVMDYKCITCSVYIYYISFYVNHLELVSPD